MKNQETKTIAKKENLSNVNVDKISKDVKKEKDVKEKKGNVYKFDYELLDTDQLKKKRQNARNKVNSFVKNIINYSDLQKDSDKLEEQIKAFKSFYKETYSLNDFSTKSIRNKIDEKERKDLERMLEIVQSNLSDKKEKKAEKLKA